MAEVTVVKADKPVAKVDVVKPEVKLEAAAPVAEPKQEAPKVFDKEPSKMVEVIPAETFRCKYGGKWHDFVKGQKKQVSRCMFEESLRGSGKLQATY